MRRVIGGISLGLGVALFVVGLLARPVLYDNLASVSLDQRSVSVSEGRDISTLRVWADGGKAKYDPLTGATVRSTRNVIGIPGAVEDESGGAAFWQTTVESEAVGVGDLSYTNEGVSFDRRTGLVANCCGDFKTVPKDAANPLGEMVDQPVKREGLFFKFPFAVEKKTYKWWDGDMNQALDMKFLREESLYGTETYVFQQAIPETEVATRDVPAEIFGGEGNTTASIMYANTRTLWVEPNTGVVVKGQEVLDKSFVSDLGEVATTKGTIGYTEATVRDNAETWGTKGRLLGFIQGPLMPIGIGLGLLLVGVGALLLMGTTGSRLVPATRRASREDRPGGVGDLFTAKGQRRGSGRA